MKIYKYQLDKHGVTILEIPAAHHKFLAVQMQNKNLVLWAEVVPEDPITVRYEFDVRVTGGLLLHGFEYLGTFQDDWFVGHVYYREVEA